MCQPEDIPEDREQSFPCDCGGSITLQPNQQWWECDECNFAKPHPDSKETYEVWTSQNGRQTRVMDMATKHIENVVNKLKFGGNESMTQSNINWLNALENELKRRDMEMQNRGE